jgi:uncharacterized membrane protein YfcA
MGFLMKLKFKAILKGGVSGFVAGVLNGLLGAGGGMIIVPILEKNGLKPAQAHATSIAIILPLCIVSVFIYVQKNSFTINDALPFIPSGIAGAILGSLLLPHIPAKLLRRIFGLFMLYAGYKLLVR